MINKWIYLFVKKIIDDAKKQSTHIKGMKKNIEDINEDLLEILKANKVNRLSIGIQTFNNKLLKKYSPATLSYIINKKTNYNLNDRMIKLENKYDFLWLEEQETKKKS